MASLNMTTSVDFDHNLREALRENARIIRIEKKRSILSCFAFRNRHRSSVQRFDALEAYGYLVKLGPLLPLDMLSVELEVVLINLGLPQVRPKLTVTHNRLDVFVWIVEIELPMDARGGLDDMTFGLREDDTFMIVVPREASPFQRAVERMEEMIVI